MIIMLLLCDEYAIIVRLLCYFVIII